MHLIVYSSEKCNFNLNHLRKEYKNCKKSQFLVRGSVLILAFFLRHKFFKNSNFFNLNDVDAGHGPSSKIDASASRFYFFGPSVLWLKASGLLSFQ